ncbi:MAG: DUF222 domain-containing protein [Microbacterium sp.]|uniref:HNH endonuclease signature motif containing protein n=1 Tax=Microbacterium sp. TaxID=51671 RepID=UPI0039E59C4C
MKTTPLTPADRRAAERMDALLPRLVETRRRLAQLQAEEARLLAETAAVADEWRQACPASEAEMPHRIVAAEIATAWRVSDRTVQREMSDAVSLVRDFPETFAALERGAVSRAHVRVILGAGTPIERPELRAEFEGAVLPYAEKASASRLAPLARRRAEWYLEETIAQRHRRACEGRHARLTDLDDGIAQLVIVGSAVLLHGIYDRATALAHADADATKNPTGTRDAVGGPETGSGDGDGPDRRTIEQRRVDVLTDLLLSADPTAHGVPTGADAIRATVSVTVPVLALIEDRVADPFETAVLDGYGPIDVGTARGLAANAPGWDRILTHPISGAVLAVDRYRPSKKMHRHLRVRDQHCRFPGCRAHVDHGDIDHTVDHALGGPTDVRNLAGLCRRHHTLKHHSTWQVRQTGGGDLEWTSPTGRVYTDRPVSTVAFATDAEFDPAPF